MEQKNLVQLAKDRARELEDMLGREGGFYDFIHRDDVMCEKSMFTDMYYAKDTVGDAVVLVTVSDAMGKYFITAVAQDIATKHTETVQLKVCY